MRLSLQSLVLAPAIMVAAALTSQPASAAVLHVPFAFTVSGQTMPAGEYTVNQDSHQAFVTLSSVDGSKKFNWILGPGDPGPGSKGVIMKFAPTENGYNLRSIQYNAMVTPKLDKKTHQNEDRPLHVIRGE